jgi:hypothetical protein
MVKPHGLRFDGNLLVPMYAPDDDDGPVNLQFINDDGRKWYLKGGRAKGCFFHISGKLERVVVCEGFARTACFTFDGTFRSLSLSLCAISERPLPPETVSNTPTNSI